MEPNLEAKLASCTVLPTLSAVALEVLRLCEAEQLDARELAGTIGRDPALAIKVVGAANSPLFALRQEVLTIAEALSVLGSNTVRTLVLSFSLVNEMEKERKGALARCWNRSAFSAVVARRLCGVRSPALKEEAFLGALLQDVGMMALARVWGSDYESLCGLTDMTHAELCAAESAALGCDHAEVGAWLLRRWSMPERLVHLVEVSHAAGAPQDLEPLNYLARCVQHSGRLADVWMAEFSQQGMCAAEGELQSLYAPDTVDLQSLLTETAIELKATAPLLQLSIEDADLESWIGGLLPAAQ